MNISSKIPIENYYYILCYAWDKLKEKELTEVKAVDSKDLIDLFAKILTVGVSKLIKKGFDRNYIDFDEELRRIRGKIDFSQSLKKLLFKNARAHCIFSELSYDVLHNQILKTIIHKLILTENVDKEIKQDLISIYRYFYEVSEIELSSRDFSNVILHRNNIYYDFLMQVCRIIYDNILINPDSGKYRFVDFNEDDSNMPKIFEEFVRNFYTIEADEFTTVKVEQINWELVPIMNTNPDRLPKMRTDISLENKERKIIIDTKYYSRTLQKNRDKETFHSGNLYQLFSYLKNIEYKGGINQTCEGILLYPTIDEELNEYYQEKNHIIRVCTINLNQPWQQIHEDLLKIVGIPQNEKV